MAKWIKTLFMGCGCGCLVLMILLAVITSRGCTFLKSSMKDFEEAIETRQQVEGQFGNPDAFTPWLDGSIPAERIETFLAVRRDSQDAREALGAGLEQVERGFEDPDLHGGPIQAMGRVFHLLSGGIGMVQEMGVFIGARNEALLTHEMGMGEYMYLYSTIYYAWIGHDVEDGNLRNVQINSGKNGGINIDIDDDDESLNPYLQVHLRSMISNWLGALGDGGDPELHTLLKAELAALREDDQRVPWQGNLLKDTEASLMSYRSALEALYLSKSNPFETVRMNKEGDMQFGPER